MKKKILPIIYILYVILSITVTILLFSFNDYRVSEYKTKSVIINCGNNDIKNYSRGSILIIKNNKISIKKGDTVFYYSTSNNKVGVKDSNIKKIYELDEMTTTVELKNGNVTSLNYVIGNDKNIKVIPILGYLLWIMESRWGYLIFVILPLLFMFIFGIYDLIKKLNEIKRVDNKSKGKNGKAKK